MVAEHRADYGSATAKAVADQLGIGKESVRRWMIQSDNDAGPASRRRTTLRSVS